MNYFTCTKAHNYISSQVLKHKGSLTQVYRYTIFKVYKYTNNVNFNKAELTGNYSISQKDRSGCNSGLGNSSYKPSKKSEQS